MSVRRREQERTTLSVTRRTVLWSTPVMASVAPAPALAASACTAPNLGFGSVAWTLGSSNVSGPEQDGVTSYGGDGASRFLSIADAVALRTGTVTYAVNATLVGNTRYAFAFTCAANYGSNNSLTSTGQKLEVQINGTTYWTGSTRALLGGTLITPTNGATTITSGSFAYTPASNGVVTFRYLFTIQPPGLGGCDDVGVSAPSLTC